MPALDGGAETMAYGPEERERLMATLREQQDGDAAGDSDAAPATVAYTPGPSQDVQDAYDLLAAGSGGSEGTPAGADSPGDQEAAPEPGEQTSPQVSQTPPIQSPLPEYGDEMEMKTGMGTLPLVIILFLLLVLAGAATAFILHFLGVVILPIEGLPHLGLFSENG